METVSAVVVVATEADVIPVRYPVHQSVAADVTLTHAPDLHLVVIPEEERDLTPVAAVTLAAEVTHAVEVIPEV